MEASWCSKAIVAILGSVGLTLLHGRFAGRYTQSCMNHVSPTLLLYCNNDSYDGDTAIVFSCTEPRTVCTVLRSHLRYPTIWPGRVRVQAYVVCGGHLPRCSKLLDIARLNNYHYYHRSRNTGHTLTNEDFKNKKLNANSQPQPPAIHCSEQPFTRLRHYCSTETQHLLLRLCFPRLEARYPVLAPEAESIRSIHVSRTTHVRVRPARLVERRLDTSLDKHIVRLQEWC